MEPERLFSFTWHPYAVGRTAVRSAKQARGQALCRPTWEGLDGGDKAVPWLLLDAKSHEGSGAFTQAQAIVCMGTTGGTAPDDGCDEARAGQELRVPYTAIYVFLK
jgi:hypothetical protein